MLKDVSDSKRINTHIEGERAKRPVDDPQPLPVSGLVLSAQFWPTFREEKLVLPQHMQEGLDEYTKGFQALKGNRTLVWKPHLGTVDVEIELGERVIRLKVSPMHAAIIHLFEEKDKWTVEELSSRLGTPVAAVKRKLALWQSHGVLKEGDGGAIVLIEEQAGSSVNHELLEGGGLEEEEVESAMASAQDQREEEYQVKHERIF